MSFSALIRNNFHYFINLNINSIDFKAVICDLYFSQKISSPLVPIDIMKLYFFL